ncbi:methyl-accepting chemotaxis protein [Marinibactrum halimedae]|uniref:Methyl-accepting chemotaxis protein n=1 Tax=Marinibactrum halimedae TaxID=1444977 RepID=A0AA37T7Y5_9GAMM|nr:methyl-accepting chemotaxis protein [Marinibactrum halimedae]MCD9458513.1 methyl-accepting chemotaxis protein [Marinibactrum halimedae]GLS26623.1 hypothetical protein GCM10007877_23390 [Marinibactrum halimedae]
MNSIAMKMMAVILAATFIVMTGVTAISYSLAKSDQLSQYEQQKQALMQQLGVILQEPVFVYDTAIIEQTTLSFDSVEPLSGITVYDHRDEILATNQAENFETHEVVTVNLEWEKRPVGRVELSLSHDYMNDTLNFLLLDKIITVSVALGCIILFITLGLNRLVTHPLQQLNAIVYDIAQGGGDLTARIPATSNDEFSTLANNFNEFIKTVQSIITELAQAVENLSGVSQQVDNICQSSSHSCKQQLTMTDTSLENIRQLAESTQEIARNAEETSENTQNASELSKLSQSSIKSNMSQVEKLVTNLENTEQVVNELKTSSNNIGTVLVVIKSIAEQTNLLALNAAIESARAGESGRGFAVVADEVRALAQKTHDSTTEIEQIIYELQHKAEASVQSTKESTRLVTDTIHSAEEADKSLDKITSSMQTIASMNHLVASATEEQSSVTMDVKGLIEEISTGAHTLTENMQELKTSTTNLVEVGGQLTKYIERFRY